MKQTLLAVVALVAMSAAANAQTTELKDTSSGKCWTASYLSGAGATLSLSPCNGSATQAFAVATDGSQTIYESGVPWGYCLREDTLTIDVCWSGYQEKWKISNGYIMSQSTGKALLPDTSGNASLKALTIPPGTWVNDQQAAAPPPPPQNPPSGNPMALGEFGAASTSAFASTYLLGKRTLDYVLIFGGQSNGWPDFETSVGWAMNVAQNQEGWGSGQLMISLPIMTTDAGNTLAAAATGAYDSHWQAAIAPIAQYGGAHPLIRIGWEQNGTWYPWRADLDPANYIKAWQRYHDMIKAAIPGAIFVWCPNRGMQAIDPVLTYPGDTYVDVIGIDSYQFGATDGTGDTAFQNIANDGGRGLNWMVQFAQQHGKLAAVPEWGTDTNDGSYIQNMFVWMEANHVAYNDFWDCNCNINSSLDNGGANATTYENDFSHWPN